MCSGMLPGEQTPGAKEFDVVLELSTKLTLVTVADADASIMTVAGATKVVPFVGLRMATVGGLGGLWTVIVIELVAFAPNVSVATAKKVYVFGVSPLTAWL